VLLIFGGSRGARNINQAILRVARDLLEKIPELVIIHSAGEAEYASCKDLLDGALSGSPELRSRYHLMRYIENMNEVMACSDLVVARAGATSIAELTALGKPSVLIPYPFATDDHQRGNAQSLVELGGARLIPDKELGSIQSDASGTHESKTTVFEDTLIELLSDDELLTQMAKSASALGRLDAAQKFADMVEDVAR
jgi:UDP-N-acetylglucosamine--N-acetylmuramyl-(pentapeptide) pyrophosphoryl-undecaprenol N-acetylglucosamine transferase